MTDESRDKLLLRMATVQLAMAGVLLGVEYTDVQAQAKRDKLAEQAHLLSRQVEES